VALPARVASPVPAAQAGQVAGSVPRAESQPAQAHRAAGSQIQRAVAAHGRAASDLARAVGFDLLATVRRPGAGLDRAEANLATGTRSDRRGIGRRAVDRRGLALSARHGLPARDSVGRKVPARRRATELLASPMRESRPAQLAPAQAQRVQDRLDPVLRDLALRDLVPLGPVPLDPVPLDPVLRAPPRPKRLADVPPPASLGRSVGNRCDGESGSPRPPVRRMRMRREAS